MLTYISNDGKTYEERMGEAIMQIPLYTEDWTDFNPSDPGLTILENLCGFETLQQEKILDVPQRVARNLLALVGFYAERGRGARLLLAANEVKNAVTIPQNFRFLLGELSFETNRPIEIDNYKVLGVYGKKKDADEYKDFASVIDRETQIPVAVFGEHPEEGDAFYIVTNKLTQQNRETVFYFSLQERFNRNPRRKRMPNAFASIRWECYTVSGWKEIDVRDGTDAFLLSGEVKMWFPEDAAVFTEAPVEGYCIRAVLDRAEYDVRPRLLKMEAFLFEVWQKKTLCETVSAGKPSELEIESGIPEELYVNVFVREQKGESYRRYVYSDLPDIQGRYYNR
ncbi:MAG: hypothetical protein IJT32_00825, partial [Lachnospiraceae bacterium]|nr:hypothetical protein [Lachnospiraceae bacterium]